MIKKLIITVILGGLFLYLLSGAFFKEQVVSFFRIKPPLKEVVEKEMVGVKGTYGIVIKDLKNGQVYNSNEDREFEAGSLYKLWVLATAFKQIEKGQLKMSDILSQDIATLNNKFSISSDSAELKDGGISLSVSDAMNQMITISHNYAALILSDKVRFSNVSQFLKDNGFKHSNVGQPPKTTAKDTALYFEKLYKGELLNEENTKTALEILKKQQLNDGLPKLLPKDIQVGHKTGDIGWFKHDGGIVFTPERDYIIVVLSESDSPLGAQQRIAQISKAVYEYFKK